MDDPIAAWAEDWQEVYDQKWSQQRLMQWVGRTVKWQPRDGSKEFNRTIVGYSIDVLKFGSRSIYRYSFIDTDGLQFPIFTGMKVKMADK